MKKILSLICTLTLIFSLSACSISTIGNDNNEGSKKEVGKETEKEQSGEMVRILINTNDGRIKSADVNKLALIDYINSTEGNEFLYEKAKESLSFKNISDDIYLDDDEIITVKSPYDGINKDFDKKLDKEILDQFNDFYYIGDNYYAGSKAIVAKIDDYEANMHQSEYGRDYRLDAIYDGKDISDFKYFIIRYLGDDVFYLFDGDKFEFINMKTKELAYEFVNERFNFINVESYDGLKIGTNGKIQMLITDEKYMITKPVYHTEDCYVETKIKNRSFMINTYPKVYTDNYEIDKKINDKIIKISNSNKDEDESIFYNEDKTSVVVVSNSYYKIDKQGKYLGVAGNYIVNGFGAHPDYGTMYFVFDLTNGELVTMDDLFTHKNSAVDLILGILADETLLRQDEIMPFEIDILEGDYSEDDLRQIFLGEGGADFNFSFTKEGLKISYTPYAIAPFVAGEIEYVISYEALRPYFKEDVIKKLGI